MKAAMGRNRLSKLSLQSVRFTPKSRHCDGRRAGQLRANSRKPNYSLRPWRSHLAKLDQMV